MTVKTKSWILGVSGTFFGTILVLLSLALMGHFKATAQTARTVEENTKIQIQHEENQNKLVEIVDKLAAFHSVEDAGLEKVAELCRAGKLKDCDDCAEAGVELGRCVN